MTIKYKIQTSQDGTDTIIKLDGGWSIPRASGNRHYQEFVEEIYTNGLGIVEGADYVGVTAYTDARAAEYPPIKDQLDKIYHSGIDAWKADIKVIKDKYPKTQVGITSIAPPPSWIDTVISEKQKEKYIEAKERLAQRELSTGVVDPVSGMHIIEPLPLSVPDPSTGGTIRNPLVVQDEKERTAAQEVITNTPQAVIDSVSS